MKRNMENILNKKKLRKIKNLTNEEKKDRNRDIR
jgi:hypothetical protein